MTAIFCWLRSRVDSSKLEPRLFYGELPNKENDSGFVNKRIVGDRHVLTEEDYKAVKESKREKLDVLAERYPAPEVKLDATMPPSLKEKPMERIWEYWLTDSDWRELNLVQGEIVKTKRKRK
jgi:hypothetical protein